MPDEDRRDEVPAREPRREDETLRQRLEAFIPDVVRRTLGAGLEALFTTEEGIRRLAAEFHLPKDVANFLVTQAQATKDELLRVAAREIRAWLDRMNLQQEFRRLLAGLTLEVTTQVRFRETEGREVRHKVSLRRAKDEEEGEDAEEPAEPR